MVNTAINHYHKQKRLNEHISNEFEADLENDIPSAIDQMSAKELLKLIQLLPDGYRLVFNLYAIEGFSHKEIAENLNISEGTSKSQLFKAKNMLKNMMAKKPGFL